jgi:hypothetical protein
LPRDIRWTVDRACIRATNHPGFKGERDMLLAGSAFTRLAHVCCGVDPFGAGMSFPPFGILLSPMIAVAAMTLGSLFVIGFALRLRTVRV